MHTREAPDFWGLHKNMNCAFPLKTSFAQLGHWSLKYLKTTELTHCLNLSHG